MRRLCTICARGGSKGVKNKNTRALLNIPLIAHSIGQATKSGLFEAIAVSSDSETILEVARQWGADYLIRRPDEFAGDHSPKLPAIVHCVTEAEKLSNVSFDVVVDLDATSPLRSIDDIQSAVGLLEDRGAPNVITASPARRSPYFNMVELDEEGHVRLVKPPTGLVARRQDSPKCYDMNASIYVWRREVLLREQGIFLKDTQLYIMPEERSQDIDTELDFEIVELLAKKRVTLY